MEPEVAKRLCFEDVSMHSPNAAFTRFEAQRCRAQPSVEQLRSVLADLSRTSESFANMVAEAAHAQVGHTDADLKRLKYAVTNLKGGVQELDGHARFLQGLLDPSTLENLPTDEQNEQWSDQVKAQKAELDALRSETEQRLQALCAEVAAFEEDRTRAAARLAAVRDVAGPAPAPAAVRGRRVGLGGAALTPPDEEPERVEETRAALAATEQALAQEEAAASAVLVDAASAEAGVRALDAQLAAARAAAAAAAEQQHGGGQHDAALVAYADADAAAVAHSGGSGSAVSAAHAAHALSELVVLLRALGGVEVLSAAPDALTLRCTPSRASGGVAHALALRLQAATAKVLSAAVEPPSVAQHQVDALVAQAQGKVHVVVREIMALLDAQQQA